MKKHKWLFINAGVCLVIIALTLLGGYIAQNIIKDSENNKMFSLDPNNITAVVYENGFNGYDGPDIDKLYFSFTTLDKNEIKAFTNCLSSVQKNNKNADTDSEAMPHYYEFTVLFENGEAASYTYRVYRTKTGNDIEDPFDAFFLLPSIQEKMEPERANLR